MPTVLLGSASILVGYNTRYSQMYATGHAILYSLQDPADPESPLSPLLKKGILKSAGSLGGIHNLLLHLSGQERGQTVRDVFTALQLSVDHPDHYILYENVCAAIQRLILCYDGDIPFPGTLLSLASVDFDKIRVMFDLPKFKGLE